MATTIEPGQLGLGPWHLGTKAAIPVTQARLNALTKAMDGIRIVLAFEDRFAMVIDNLMDLERHLFNWALHDMLRPFEGMDDLFTHKRDANRLLGNLLSSCRQYIDQTHHQLKAPLKGLAVTSKAALSEQYDAILGYRVMEALRNYVQHEDLGVHTVSVDGAWIDTPGKHQRRYVVSIGLDLDHLSKATKFKAATLAELQALPVVPDLKQMIREYVSGLSTAHKKMRDALAVKVKAWSDELDAAFADVQAALPSEKLHSLMVFKQNDDGQREPLLDVFLNPRDRLRTLQRLNQTTLNLGPAYASSEALTPKPKKK